VVSVRKWERSGASEYRSFAVHCCLVGAIADWRLLAAHDGSSK
jgi:hypothetical protein